MRLAALGLLVLLSSGCTYSMDWIRDLRAQRAVARQDYAAALPLLQKIADVHKSEEKGLKAARQGARVAHLEAKDYFVAVDFYKHIVLRSPEPEERKAAQRFIAQIYFENLQDFDQSMFEYEKLLKLDNTPEEAFRYRLNLAKSHFQMNNLEQTVNELDVLLEKKPPKEHLFEIKSLKANVLVANKHLSEAASVWEEIMKEFPERSMKENVAMNLVVCYEELKDFNKAIAVLENMREGYSNPKFLDSRIERLRERLANLPGARGWKK